MGESPTHEPCFKSPETENLGEPSTTTGTIALIRLHGGTHLVRPLTTYVHATTGHAA